MKNQHASSVFDVKVGCGNHNSYSESVKFEEKKMKSLMIGLLFFTSMGMVLADANTNDAAVLVNAAGQQTSGWGETLAASKVAAENATSYKGDANSQAGSGFSFDGKGPGGGDARATAGSAVTLTGNGANAASFSKEVASALAAQGGNAHTATMGQNEVHASGPQIDGNWNGASGGSAEKTVNGILTSAGAGSVSQGSTNSVASIIKTVTGAVAQ